MKKLQHIAMAMLLFMTGAASTSYAQTIKGNIYGGGQLAQVKSATVDAKDTICSVSVATGDVYGRIYGAGEGVVIDDEKDDVVDAKTYAKVTGSVQVNLLGGAVWQDIYGGGAKSVVTHNASVNLTGGTFARNVYGGGEGFIKTNANGSYYYDRTGKLVITSADVMGNTSLTIKGSTTIWDRTTSTMSETRVQTKYIYTKNTPSAQVVDERYDVTDGNVTAEDVISSLQNSEYTDITVSSIQSETGESTYYYIVSYKIPDDSEGVIVEDEQYIVANSTVTADEVRTALAAQGYEDITVGTLQTETPETKYYYLVSYTTPETFDKRTLEAANPQLVMDGYHEEIEEELISTVAGEIWNWDPSQPSTYRDQENKIDNKIFYDDATMKFLVKHNVFGGGYLACRVGTYDDKGNLEEGTGDSSVEMEQGLFGQDLMQTQQWKECYNDNQDPHFYVFGGGYGAYTSVGNTKVHIGVNADIGDTPTIDQQWAKPNSFPTLAKRLNGTLSAQTSSDHDNGNISIFDDSYGLPKYTVLGVLGGGYAGIVLGNTDVQIGGNTFMHRIYGGGYGQLDEYNKFRSTDKIFGDLDRESLGIVMGNTYVETQGGFIQGDVFGGGAGVESAHNNAGIYEVVDGNSVDKDFVMGVVNGITEVRISGDTKVYGNVYGGGDVACVLGTGDRIRYDGNTAENTSDVSIVGGFVSGNVFGGGSGRVASKVLAVTDNAVEVGSVTGNTLVTIDKSEKVVKEQGKEDVIVEIIPDIYGSIYGGGAYGQILKSDDDATDGNTSVIINDGNIGNNIFGGGLGNEAEDGTLTSANIAGSTSVQINGGQAMWKTLSDANGNTKLWNVKENVLVTDEDKLAVRMALVSGDNTIFRKLLKNNVDENFFDVEKLEFKKDHNVYGGGEYVCQVDSNAYVTVNHALVTDAQLLSPYNAAGLCWAASIDNKEHPQFSVFGGGFGPLTTVNNTIVKMQCGKNEEVYTPADDDVINGTRQPGEHKADYTYSAIDSDRLIWKQYFGKLVQEWNDGTVTNSDKDKYYGGNNGAGVWRYAVSQLAWSSGIPNLIMRGVFGGGYAGFVKGNTNVTVSDMSCLRYLYGGGLGSKDFLDKYDTSNADNIYNRLGEVHGNSTVVLSGGVISREVYGGGAGIEPKKLGDSDLYTDLIDMARVNGKTSVTISGSPLVNEDGARGTVVIGDVFGGGDVANVGKEDASIAGTSPDDADFVTSKVIISSGCMLGQVFAGGNGRIKEQCADYRKVGAVYGNTLLSVDGYDASSSVGPETNTKGKGITYIFKRMFGGGNNGSVLKTSKSQTNSGHTYVIVSGGYFAYNVFGGGVGTINTTVDENTGDVIDNNTYSYVEGDTHVKMLGGLAIVDQYWDAAGLRQWAPINEYEGKKYSAQYDPEKKKLLINHNVYAGCRNAGYVNGSTYLTMKRSYLRSSLRAGTYAGVADNFFESQEWEEIYNKIGSPHFCIFGGGFGENTHIMGDTWVDIDIDAKNAGLDSPVELSEADHDKSAAHRFEGGQSVMDIIGGGYSGSVAGATHVKISGDVYARRIFGGSFYAPVSQTNIQINSINVDDIFGGGMMGNVEKVQGTLLNDADCGKVNLVVGKPNATTNNKIFINNNIFGGNDVSGVVRGQITNSIFGGIIYNNVYGAGNGNYLYAINDKVKLVTTHEDYMLNSQKYDLVYEVPKREEMEFSMQSASDAQKIVNINTYRPNAQKVCINIAGSGSDAMVQIRGNVFGGGNTATVNNLDGDPSHTSVAVNIGSHCKIGGVYMGNDGDAMFSEETGSQDAMDAFQKINGVDFAKEIRWNSNPMDRTISEWYLPVKVDDRPKVYPHVLDLYFQPVEMPLQPDLNWCSSISYNNSTEVVTPNVDPAHLENTTIGIFVCGGNRGNMNVVPNADGSIVDYEFPQGLTITNRIVGGCNNANYTLGKITHVGGYLLGKRNTDVSLDKKPAINLLVKCKFNFPDGMTSLLNAGAPLKDDKGNAIEQRNVYGGCYNSGTINGDINIDFRSHMLTADNVGSDDVINIAKTYFGSEIAMGNVYGAGYGSESYVYGNTQVTVGRPISSPSAYAKGNKALDDELVSDDKYVAMSVYGGGQLGNVIGNTTVRVLNGHIGKSVVGGSYAGYMWGSTQVVVGYPKYHIAKRGGKYKLMRSDKWNTTQKNHDNSLVVKQEISLLPGDIVSEEVYDAIREYDTHHSTSQAIPAHFKDSIDTPQNYGFASWDDIDIIIDEACYGGGYSLASGSSVAAGEYTVKKYNNTMNITDDYSLENDLKRFLNHTGNTSTIGYGGNTTVLVWDDNSVEQTKSHINISTQTMKEVFPDKGTDLFGYYHKKEDGTYGYIYQEGEFFYYPSDAPAGVNYYERAFESNSEGGMYGDGHLSFAEGFRAGELLGYGFAENTPDQAKIINTFQRMDMLRIKDCTVAVLGARDYTVNEISTTPYSVARIGELQMIADNVKNRTSGTLLTTDKKRSRNYLGLSNNIHYVGAVMSNVDFNSAYHYGNKDAEKAIGTAGTDSYRAVKQQYISDKENAAEFQKRNDGTAANMIGISSGYALKVQNVFTTEDATTESYFYGPVVGVVEMNLIDVREDEGGGYVYADNVHHRSHTAFDGSKGNYDQVPETVQAEEDFLETSGNFVFPYDVLKNRYIVDDCFPTEFMEHPATAEAHYWYVTGYNYYFNAHITGYTYNTAGEGNALFFNSDKDNLLSLTGAKAGQKVVLQSIKWRSIHKDDETFDECDIETNKNDGTKDTGYGNPLYRLEDEAGKIAGEDGAGEKFEHFIYNHYNLSMSAINNITGTYSADSTGWANMPLTTNLDARSDRYLSQTLKQASPVIAFQLADNVDNSGIDYFTKYMSQPCQATVVLTCPATDSSDQPILGNVPISYFFTRSGSEGNYVYTKLADGTVLDPSTTYYYFGNGNDYHSITTDKLKYYSKEQNRYVSILGDTYDVFFTSVAEYNTAKGTSLSADEFAALTAEERKKTTLVGPALDPSAITSGSQEYTFYDYTERLFTYTIYLTIDYVQGPDVSGNIKIYNCALPGERIKIDKGTIKIKSDVSMAQTETLWKFTRGSETYVFDQAHPYDPTADTNTTSELLRDVIYADNEQCIYVPAYYFMNGFNVQYYYKVNGIDQEFNAPRNPATDFLTIHNYHRMLPRSASGKEKVDAEFHLELAAKRAAEDAIALQKGTITADQALSEPRIYIADDVDLNELPRFLNEKAEDSDEAGSKYDFGNHMQFHLLNDITVKTEQEERYVPAVGFKGTLHGNGYVISGLGVKTGDHTAPLYLFDTTTPENYQYNIYNLGLKQGYISNADLDAGSDIATNTSYHCLYTWANKAAYRMNGDIVKTFTDDDYRWGRVAYELNQYYLEERTAKLTGTPSSSGYVEDIYHNGDYRFARANKEAKTVYLRSDVNDYDANYNSYPSYHLFDFDFDTYHISHKIDAARAVIIPATLYSYEEFIAIEGNEAVTRDQFDALTDAEKTKIPEQVSHYLPLFEEAEVGSDVETATSKLRNDYIFFGQTLNASTKNAKLAEIGQTLPAHIAADKTHELSAMYNRLFRAGGYYMSNASGKRYTTSAGAFYHNEDAYVHDNGITAIDFHNYSNPADCFYSPVVDYGLKSLNSTPGVTRNLLVYARSADDINDIFADNIYTESTSEVNVKMHILSPTCTEAHDAILCTTPESKPVTSLFHLVERTKAGKDASGATCLNNDFDAPYAFNVTQRAWYTRQPLYYAEASNTAWEGICLPFTVNKAVASLNQEITHFYGTPTEDQISAPETNDKTLHHEYWLRGLTSVADSDTDDATLTAFYTRPGSESPLFSPAEAVTGDHHFENTWFVDTYTKNYNWNDPSNQNKWYAESHDFAGYHLQTADVPYVVSFPGNQYYEFDLTSKFYNDMKAASEKLQTITFNNYVSGSPITIEATANRQKTTHVNLDTETAYRHTATYLYIDDAQYAMNDGGTAFDEENSTVLPFRTYMHTAAYVAPAQGLSAHGLQGNTQQLAKRSILIAETKSEDNIEVKGVEERDPSDGTVIQDLRIYPRGKRIIVESPADTTLRAYTMSGQLVRVLDVREGTNTYSGFSPGVYIVGNTRVVVK